MWATQNNDRPNPRFGGRDGERGRRDRERNKEEVVTKKMSLNTYSKTLQMDKDIAIQSVWRQAVLNKPGSTGDNVEPGSTT